MLLSLLCPDTRIIGRASKLLLSRTDTAVDLMQWLVYSRESSQSTEIVFINDPRVFLPRGELQYQTLSDSLYREPWAFATASSETVGVLINIVQMPLLGILLDYSRFRTFFHPLKSQMGHRFACGFCRVHPAPGRHIFVRSRQL